jgi:HAD superfamily hydrolase (TIGR01509 family)
MSDFDLIIFDCDGTLTDSENINNTAFVQALHEEGFTNYTLEYGLANWLGIALSTIMLQIQMETGRMPSSNIVSRYSQLVSEMQLTELKPIQGAGELIAAVKEHYKICVASNGERSNVLQSLRITDLMQYFTEESVFTKIQVKNPKPYPDLFLFAADKMGVAPERCLVIEDSAAGVRAGVAAGMKVFGFSGSAHQPALHADELKAAGAHEIFDRLIHIRNAIAY